MAFIRRSTFQDIFFLICSLYNEKKKRLSYLRSVQNVNIADDLSLKLLLLHFWPTSSATVHTHYTTSIILVRWDGINGMVDTPNLNHIASSYMLIGHGLCKHIRHYILQSRVTKQPLSQKPRNNNYIYYEISYWNKIILRTLYTIIIRVRL